MAMLAGARSLHARPWERRYRHAFGGWFERGRLLEPTSGRGAVSPRSPGSHLGSQWAIPKMRGHWIQAKKCKASLGGGESDAAGKSQAGGRGVTC